MASGGSDSAPLPEASSSTSESQSAYNDLKHLIPSLAAELELLRTSLREHSLWLLRYGHTNSLSTAPNPQDVGHDTQPPIPSGTTGGRPLNMSPTREPSAYIEPPLPRPAAGPTSQPPQPPPAPASSSASDPELPAYSASDVPPYTGGFSSVSASTREEVRHRRDQLTEWLREGEDVLREYSARFAQLAQELGQPHEDLLGTWIEANPDNALPDYQRIEEREELMVGGVGEVPPPYLGDGGVATPKGGER